MPLLKFALAEAGDDALGEQHVAVREYTEFDDECRMVFYRSSSEAPAEVLLGVNRGDMPEEVLRAERDR